METEEIKAQLERMKDLLLAAALATSEDTKSTSTYQTCTSDGAKGYS